jgi:hypothetical protein
MRVLRSYERIAHDFHHCDYCYRQIEPGDSYKGAVFLYDEMTKHRLIVRKQHIMPECEPDDPFEDEDEDRDYDWERDNVTSIEGKVKTNPLPLPLAA